MLTNPSLKIGLIIFLVFVSVFIPFSVFQVVNRSSDLRSRAADATMIPQNFWAYDSHPDFWPTGEAGGDYTGKLYNLYSGTPSPGYNQYWVWSGPQPGGKREVVYQPYNNGQANPNYLEWELWSGDPVTHRATVYQYAGSTPQTSKQDFTMGNCPTNPGFDWPSVPAGLGPPIETITTDFLTGNECTSQGYVSVKVKEYWDTPFSQTRNSSCDQYIASSASPVGNLICKTSPNAGIVFQRYVSGSTPSQGAPVYVHGCEAVVYAWGYPYDSSSRYQNWFRNGEIRFSNWMGLGNLSTYHDATDPWWDAGCSQAFSAVTNWVYSGSYKPNGTDVLVDSGAASCDQNSGTWSACTKSCGGGTQTRTDSCGTVHTQSCNVQTCCDPNSWSAWSSCSASCGGGTQTRTNACGNTANQSCNTQPCPTPPGTQCIPAAGQTCTAICAAKGWKCQGAYEDQIGCVNTKDPSCDVYATHCLCNSCDPNVWGSWSACTKSCGGGTQTRTNACGTSQSQSCNTQACPPPPPPPPPPVIKLGDINKDGFVNILDLRQIINGIFSAFSLFDYSTSVTNFGR